jgi:nitrous oxidase accessory protein NosD
LIQQLINNAQPFDCIIIPNGTFQEHLSINKPISLIGSGHTIIDGMYQDSVLTIQSSDVHILNITFMNSGGDTSYSGISAQGINITIEHCDFIFSKQGIQFNNSEQSSILNCSFHQLGKGMALLNSTNISIKSSMVSRCGIGSFLHSSSNVYLNTSTFQTNGLSVYASECENLIMNRVIIQDTSDNHGGLFVQDSSIITINQSKIHHNGIGINIDQSDHVIISTCEITNNTHFGVLLRTHADHITIKNCLIKNNLRYGIYCFEKTSAIVMRNIITDNYLFGLYSKNPVFVLDENWWDSPMGPTMLPFHSGERLSLNNFIFHFGQWNTSSFTLTLQDLIPKYQYQQFISKNISIFLEGIDSDGDGAPDWWEEKWGYQTESKDKVIQS